MTSKVQTRDERKSVNEPRPASPLPQNIERQNQHPNQLQTLRRAVTGGASVLGNNDFKHLHQTIGNRAVGQLLRQRDAPADSRVSREPAAHPSSVSHAGARETSTPRESDSGSRLPVEVRSKMERAFNADFSDVKIQEGGRAASVGAIAYTAGDRIHFAHGRYQPHSQAGQELLGHELTHVVQQRAGRVRQTAQLKGVAVNLDSALEREADVSGKQAAQGNRVSASASSTSRQSKKAASDAAQPKIIQRKSDNLNHNQQFLASSIFGKGVDTTDAEYLKALASAYFLDYHAYERAINNFPIPIEIQSVLKDVPVKTEPQKLIEILYGYIAKVNPNPLSQIKWGAMTKAGTGSSVEVKFHREGHAVGSPTAKNPPWMQELSKRRDGLKSVYVMGHLLNADLGGPGLDYNFVPLTGRGGWYGANNANGIHSDIIEQVVKEKYALLENKGTDEVTNLEYSVVADFKRAARNTQITKLEHFKTKLDDLVIEAGKHGFKLTKGTLAKQPTNVKDWLKQEIAKEPGLEATLKAISSLNFWSRNMSVLIGLLEENIKLWKYEDQTVPNSLKVKVSWDEFGQSNQIEHDIPVRLPTALDAPYQSSKKLSSGGEEPEKHQEQFREHLQALSDAYQKNDKEAMEARLSAYLLDLNEYDRELLSVFLYDSKLTQEVSDRLTKDLTLATPRLASEVEADKELSETLKLRYAEALEIPGFKQIAQVPEMLPILSELLKAPSTDLFKKMQDYVQGNLKVGKQNVQLTKIVPEGKTPWSTPSIIHALLQKDGQAVGSSAGGNPSWMLQLEQRRDSTKTLYVRGHLLNRHLGGAGLDHNMVPLTGRSGWFGANNANAIHSNIIEEIVKNQYGKLRGANDEKRDDEVSHLEYHIAAVFGDHKRPQTAQIGSLYKSFLTIIAKFEQDIATHLSQMNKDEFRNKVKDFEAGSFIETLNVNQQEAKQMLAMLIQQSQPNVYDPRKFTSLDDLYKKIVLDYKLDTMTQPDAIELWKTLSLAKFSVLSGGKRKPAEKMLGKSIYLKELGRPIAAYSQPQQQYFEQQIKLVPHLASVLDAVSTSGDYQLDTLKNLQSLMKDNYDLWKLEDAYVPLHLEVKASWVQFGAAETVHEKVPNRLPNALNAPFNTREEDVAM